MSQIGIKLANHDFFPIIDEDGKLPIEKELELTTVRDNQESVQINLFKSDGEAEPVYIGSLIVEDLNKLTSGDATILLRLTLDENKNLSAEAIDKDSGNKQSLSIPINDQGQFLGSDFNFDGFGDSGDVDVSGDVDSLDVTNFATSLDDDFLFDENSDSSNFDSEEFQAFSFDGDDIEGQNDGEITTFDDFSSERESIEDEEVDEDEFYEEKKSSFPTWLKIFLIILIFGLLALVVALFLKNKIKMPKNEVENIESVQQDMSPLQSEKANIEEHNIDDLTTEAPKKEAEPFPNKEATTAKEVTTITNEEVKKKEEVKIVKDGAIKKAVRYRVRWGDTLWDISGNFYKNPWAYKRIARYNKIKNPHKIIAGTYITIPAK
ncbi:MAG: LysM peptidoglycan-binding domain-containing protein [Treponema sp.]